MDKKLPFGLPTQGFDGSVPFATIEVWDPGFNDSLTITCKNAEDFLANWTRTTNVVRGEQQTWAGKYLFHATGRPAIKFFNGNQAWFKNGQLHNKDGPARDFDGKQMYSLGGQLIPDSLFGDYLIYLDRLEKMGQVLPANTNKIPTFPNRYEIKTANKYSLALFFDYDLNYYWMNESGQMHHPTEPAFQGLNGLVQHWENGRLMSERIDAGFRNDSLDQIRKEIEEMVKHKFEETADVIVALDKEDLRGVFEEAGRMFEAGYGIDDIAEWFGRAYGDGWPEDFSKSLMDDFKGLVEEVIDYIEGQAKKGDTFKRVKPVKLIKEEPAEEILIGKLEIPKPVEMPTGETLAEWHERVEKVLQAAQKMEVERKAVSEVAAKLEAAQKFASAGVRPNHPPLIDTGSPDAVATVSDERSTEQESGWALPLGALAVAGLVGFLGSRKEAAAAKEIEAAQTTVHRG